MNRTTEVTPDSPFFILFIVGFVAIIVIVAIVFLFVQARTKKIKTEGTKIPARVVMAQRYIRRERRSGSNNSMNDDYENVPWLKLSVETSQEDGTMAYHEWSVREYNDKVPSEILRALQGSGTTGGLELLGINFGSNISGEEITIDPPVEIDYYVLGDSSVHEFQN